MNPTYDDIVTDVQLVADKAKIDPSDVNVTLYKRHGGRYSEREIRSAAGGLKNLIKDAFPATGLNRAAITGTAIRSKYVRALETEIGKREYLQEKFKQVLVDCFETYPVKLTKPSHYFKLRSNKTERTNVAHISDTHFGIEVDQLEVEGNSYSWQIAARRFGMLAENISNFKSDHRSECSELVINVGGDQMAGVIHMDDRGIDLLANQLVGTIRYLISFIDYQRIHYGKVRVEVTYGNHDRPEYGGKRGRTFAQKYDSYLSVIAEGVRQAFRHDSGVVVHQPLTPYTLYKIFDHNYFLFHGDTCIFTGNPHKKIETRELAQKLDSINASRRDSDRIHAAFAGHVHSGAYCLLDSGVHLFINPSLIGVDSYSTGAMGAFTAPKGQWLVEVTRDYAAGDMRLVNVGGADQRPEFETIIPAFRSI